MDYGTLVTLLVVSLFVNLVAIIAYFDVRR
jgi:hypothetical protein